MKIGLEALEKQTREYYTGEVEMNILVKKGDTVETKQIIAKGKESKQKNPSSTCWTGYEGY